MIMEELETNEEMILKIMGCGGFSKIYSFNLNKTLYDDDEIETYTINLPMHLKKYKNDDTKCLKISVIDVGYKEFKYLTKLKHENIINAFYGGDDFFNDKYLTILEKHDSDLKTFVEKNIYEFLHIF